MVKRRFNAHKYGATFAGATKMFWLFGVFITVISFMLTLLLTYWAINYNLVEEPVSAATAFIIKWIASVKYTIPITCLIITIVVGIKTFQSYMNSKRNYQ